MNKEGNPANLVPSHPRNLHALKSGAHSPRLIEARASEIVDEFGVADRLDEAGKTALWELARLTAVIEAIDRDLSDKGVTDRNGKERYVLQRRERYSRRLMEVSDRVLDAQTRMQKQEAINSPDEVVGERRDYVRELQSIALGHDADARVSDRLAALKLLTDLGGMGTTSHFNPSAASELYADDPAFQAEMAQLTAELEKARKRAELDRVREKITFTQLGAY